MEIKITFSGTLDSVREEMNAFLERMQFVQFLDPSVGVEAQKPEPMELPSTKFGYGPWSDDIDILGSGIPSPEDE